MIRAATHENHEEDRRAHGSSLLDFTAPAAARRLGTIRHLILTALLLTACHGHETPGSADPPVPQIVTDQLRPARLSWSHTVIGPDDVDDQAPGGVYVVTFPSGLLYEDTPGHLRFTGHGLEGFDTKTPVSFTTTADVTRGEMPGPFGGSVRLHYSELEGTLDLPPDDAKALLADLEREPLTTQFLIRVLGANGAGDVTVTDCELLGVRVLSERRGEVLLQGVPAVPLRG